MHQFVADRSGFDIGCWKLDAVAGGRFEISFPRHLAQ